MKRWRVVEERSWLGALACVGVLGCAVESAPGDSKVVSEAMAAPEFGEVYDVLQQSCGGGMSGCHITGTAAGLAMPDEGAAHASLVNVASPKCEGAMRVAPGDADASVLVQVLEGTSACVKPMPLGRDALSQDAIDLIREWIDSGAEVD
jgi:hypothetical protein